MNKIKLPNQMSPLLAEEIGLHLGDGSMNYYKNKGLYQLRGHIIDDRDHYNLRVKVIYKELFNLTLNLREMSSCGVYGFQIWSNDIVKFKEEVLSLPLGKKIDFSVPKGIINNKELRDSIGQQARTMVEKRFTIDRMAEEMKAVYTEVCEPALTPQ